MGEGLGGRDEWLVEGGGGEGRPARAPDQLRSRKNLHFKTHFWCLSHLVPKM